MKIFAIHKVLARSSLLILICPLIFACNKKQSFGGLPEFKVPLGSPPVDKEPLEAEPEEKSASLSETPDPVAMRVKNQYALTFHFERGEVTLLKVESKVYATAQLTPRRLGRFAVEFWIGQELLERVRFNFPLLGASSGEGELEAGLTTSMTVEVPLVPRATHARILDRESRKEWSIELPLVSDHSVAASP